MQKPIGVGLIGANPDKGWGSAVHVPAIAHVPGLALTAVGTTRAETAQRSAERFGAARAFSDPQALANCPDVDLVAIAVKAPDHYQLAMTALAAGKHVYCEWPLAANHAQAAEMTALAKRKGICAMVGLQSRGSPVLRHTRALIAQGFVGRVVAVRMECALPGGGRRRSQEGLYVIDKANGASTLAIQGGHAIDALRFVAGPIASLASVVANQFDEIEVVETGERHAKDAPDQILVSGRLQNDAVVSIAINGGVVAGHGVAIRIFGEEGSLLISGQGKSNVQMSDLELHGARLPDRVMQPIPVDEGALIPPGLTGAQPYPGVDVPRSTLVNVAALYADMERAIRSGDDPSPGFTVGLSLHALLDAIAVSSHSGIACADAPA